MSTTPLLLKRDATGEALYSTRAYWPEDLVLRFDRLTWRPMRDRYTVQHPAGGHIFHPILAKVSHACEPNCRVSLRERALFAVRPILPGEAITFDYQTTESRLSHPFQCVCRSPRCRGWIA
jgi:tyrocidine synthetase-3